MDLLAELKTRKDRKSEFNYGIRTADIYVKTFQECQGGLCSRYAPKGHDFGDLLKKSTSQLVYSNDDMVVEDLYGTKFKRTDKDGDELALPKNTLMVFKHVITTSRKDRDGDILRTEGAVPDPKMLLLWQHVHTLPIGKMLQIADHTKDSLSLVTAIVDMNELSHDAAVMVDNDMARFSHGFRALNFSKIKEETGSTTSPGGFDVKEFEIMEESIVSVPSNKDAEVEEMILDYAEGGKLTSAIMKNQAKQIRSQRSKSVSVPIEVSVDLKVNGKSIGGEEHEHVAADELDETKCTKCSGGKEGCGCAACSSEKTDDDKGEDTGEDSKDEKMTCTKCGGKMVDGVCEKCGYGKKAEDEEEEEVDEQETEEEEEEDTDVEKKNFTGSQVDLLKQVKAALEDIRENEIVLTKGCRERHSQCIKDLTQVIEKADADSVDENEGTLTFEKLVQAVLFNITPEEQSKLIKCLKAIETKRVRTELKNKLLGVSV